MPVLFLLVSVCAYTQVEEKREKFPSYFGLILSPTLPTSFLGPQSSTAMDTTGQMSTTFKQKTGYMFGATIRIGLTKRFSIETGISQIHRNYEVTMDLPDSSIHNVKSFSFISYDIPVNGLVYVQMGQQWYMNAYFGVSISQYPSDTRDTTFIGKNTLAAEGRRTKRTYFALNAGIGFEFRTKKAGTFYLGAGGKVPLKDIMIGVGLASNVYNPGKQLITLNPVNGSFMTVDFRYFLPTIKNKGKQPMTAPL